MAQSGSILGNSVLRKEDPGLLIGTNQYTDDMKYPNMGHVVFVRSSVAHARLLSVDTSTAKGMPGVTVARYKREHGQGVEAVLGDAIRGRRDTVLISTKTGLPMGDGPQDWGASRTRLIAAIDASLERLGTDYIDLYIIHRFDYDTPLEETLQALDDVVRGGKVRYLGASSMHAWQFMKALGMQRANGWATFVSMQNYYNLLYREDEREMLRLCASEGVGVTPWSPLARGRLARPWADEPVTERLPGSLAAALQAVRSGAQLIRVHDVAATRQALSLQQHIGLT